MRGKDRASTALVEIESLMLRDGDTQRAESCRIESDPREPTRICTMPMRKQCRQCGRIIIHLWRFGASCF